MLSWNHVIAIITHWLKKVCFKETCWTCNVLWFECLNVSVSYLNAMIISDTISFQDVSTNVLYIHYTYVSIFNFSFTFTTGAAHEAVRLRLVSDLSTRSPSIRRTAEQGKLLTKYNFRLTSGFRACEIKITSGQYCFSRLLRQLNRTDCFWLA